VQNINSSLTKKVLKVELCLHQKVASLVLPLNHHDDPAIMSNWWNEAISSVPIAPVKVHTCTPSTAPLENEGSVIDSTSSRTEVKPFSFHGISVTVNPHPAPQCIQEEPRRVLIKLTNFSGTIELLKNAPPSRFTSSFNIRVDEAIPKPLEMPTWLTEPASSPNNAASKRKTGAEKPYEHMIPRKVARITTPEAASEWDVEALEAFTSGDYEPEVIRYGMNRSGHVAWLIPGAAGSAQASSKSPVLCVHGGIGSSGAVCSDIVHLTLHGSPLLMATASRPLCSELHSRTGHTALRLPDCQGPLIMFGGRSLTPSASVSASASASTSTSTSTLMNAGADADAETEVDPASASEEYEASNTDALLVLDPETAVWYPPAVSGKGPSARAGHSAALLLGGRGMVIYGGESKGRFPHNIHWLDTSRWHWHSPKCEGKPPKARAGHCCYAFSSFSSSSSSSSSSAPSSLLSAGPGAGAGSDVHDLVIFGGHDGAECFNDVHLLRCVERKAGSGQCTWQWMQPEVRGLAPCASASAIASATVSGSGAAAAASHVTGLPRPRTAFASCVVGQGRYLFVRGGSTWDVQQSAGGGRSAGATVTVATRAGAAEAGTGADEMYYCADCYLLDMWEWVWHPVQDSVCDGVRVVVDPTAIDSSCPPEEEAFFYSAQTSDTTTATAATRGRMGESACVLLEEGEEFILLFGGLYAATVAAAVPASQSQSQSSLPTTAEGEAEPDPAVSPKACANVSKIRVKSLLASINA